MSGVILIGDELSRQDYFNTYVKDHTVPSYNIRIFDTVLKISDVRELIHYVSLKGTNKSERLVFVKNLATIEAQNALLKTLEELNEDVCIFLAAATTDQYLPTIVSRCSVIRQTGVRQTQETDAQLRVLVQQLTDTLSDNSPDKYLTALLAIGEYCEEQEYGFDTVILVFRDVLKDAVERSQVLSRLLVTIIANLDGEYSFVEKNNGNARLVLESSLFDVRF